MIIYYSSVIGKGFTCKVGKWGLCQLLSQLEEPGKHEEKV